MVGIILAILLFIFLVIIHELGHFTAAKKTGVKVLEFGLGIPPKLRKLWTDASGTEYTLNAIPLGGFVRLKGENPEIPEDFNASDSFVKASLVNKLIILIAGVFVNALFAWIAFSASFMVGVYPINIIPESMIVGESRSYLMPTRGFLEEQGFLTEGESIESAIVSTILPNSLAEQIGLQVGDQIVSINDQTVNSRNLGEILKDHIGKDISLLVVRSEQDDPIIITTSCQNDGCFLGVVLEGEGQMLTGPIKFPPVRAVGAGLQEIAGQTSLTFKILGTLGRNLFSFNKERISSSVNRLSGPVGIVKFGEGIFDAGGIWPFLAFGGMISLALAIFNILPIPALDGGRMLGVLIQELSGAKPEKYFIIENYINMVFFVLLMFLGVYIILLDLTRFWNVSIPFIG